ncbi:MAG TPA: glycoside hydrolase family 3 C-terminal domain-containing protein [Terracidiphilus sp.]|nr:glycoside hydrolase family 3 C-terminal domain-containing protein [Terracidiphilus sp.]
MRMHPALLAVAFIFACTVSGQQRAQTPAPAMPFRNPSLPIDKRVDDLVGRLTLEEKVSQLIDRAPAIPRLDIPAYNWWNEGLHGVARSGYATLFPQAIGNAATWDTPLIHSIGEVVSTEARAKYNDAIAHDNHDRYFGLTIWSPNINIFRDPRWGRGQETYGEDPFLTAHLGTAFVEGIQGTDSSTDSKYFRAIATPKHYAVHSGPESTRHKADVDPTPHDLWDTYLPAFRATIVDGKADSIMCSYNAVDKVPACANKMLLGDILRGDWHFNGFVTSDCGAIGDFYESYGHHYSPDAAAGSAAGILAGTDTDCGTEYRALTEAVHKGLLTEAQLDVSLKRLFTARMKLGMFDPPEQVPFSKIQMKVVNSPEHAALALRAARESIVLLKNENHFLPLDPAKHQTIAVVGPLAGSRVALEGNYNAIPLHPILPIDGIESEFGHEHVLYAQGSAYIANGDLPVPRTMLRAATDSTVDGLEGQYFSRPGFDGPPTMVRIDKEIDFDWAFANPVEPGDTSNQAFAVRWVGALRPPVAETLNFQFRLPICFPCEDKLNFAVYLDGKKLQPEAPPSPSATKLPPSGRNYGAVQHFAIPFSDTRPHELRIEYIQSARITGAGLSFEWTPSQELLQKQAVEAASKADAVIAFVGLTARLEGEEMKVDAKGFSGGDRTDIDLPDVQQQLLEAVAKTGKPVTVVLLNGSALAVNWAQQNARALLEAWYPGQSGGQAIAETLSGKNNPSGRLPVTFYTGVDQLPAFDDYSMANRTYRYFKGKPLYAFGDGLSYTTFAYSGLKLSTNNLKAGSTLTVEADLKNTGSIAGDEVSELYLVPPQSSLSPKQALVGFQRLHLNPGESRHISFQLDPRTLSQVDEKGTRAVTAGEYKLSLGSSQPDGMLGSATASTRFTITGTQQLPR